MEYIKFLEKARKVHGDKYDYSKFENPQYNEKVCIICPEHGEFWQLPSKHLYGQGCPKCAHPNSKLTKEEFIEKANIKHNNKYDYTNVSFNKLKDKIEIICPEHGKFMQSVKEHLKGSGCPKCSYIIIGNKKRYNTLTFIKKAREKHGNKYDYSKTEYLNNTTQVLITCPEHGDYYQLPSVHLNGGGCPKCAKKYNYKTDEIISKFKEIHGKKYNYSKVEYVNAKTKVCIVCPEHGEFWQLPSVHLNGGGCPICGREHVAKTLSMTTQEFIEKADNIHNGKYDYSKVEYVNMPTKVHIICPEHGEFEQSPRVHLNGGGCPKCGLEYLKNINTDSTDVFIEKARKTHGDTYDYTQTQYKGRKNKVTVICPEHGKFSIIANNHLNGQGCPECSKISFREKRIIPFKIMVERANAKHNGKYTYDNETYIQFNTKMKITCPEHGEFWQTPTDHINEGHRCPSCAHIESNMENEIYSFLHEYFNVTKRDRKLIEGKEIDLLVPEKKIGIEFNGLHWHDDKHVSKNYHLKKTEAVNKKGYSLIHIFEDEWVEKKELVINKLKHLLSINEDKKHIGARNTIIKQIDKGTANVFLEKYHIQGKVNSSLYYGAFTKKK